MDDEHWWGIKPESWDGVHAAWGARAIVDDGGRGFSLLSDRQQYRGEPEAQAALSRALAHLIAHALNSRVLYDGRSERTFDVAGRFNVNLRASTKASCGYLYLGCWLTDGPGIDPEHHYGWKNGLPKVGARVNVALNDVGPSLVLRRFIVSHDDGDHTVGIVVMPLAPPDWLKKQITVPIISAFRAEVEGAL